MCDKCLEVNGLADEIVVLTQLMKSNRTDEDTQRVIDAIPALKDFRIEDFNNMPLSDLCSLIAVRAARATSIATDQLPGQVMNEWFQRVAASEIAAMIEGSPIIAILMELDDENAGGL